MKILHVINSLGSGGAEKLLEILTPELNSIDNVTVNILLLTDEKNVFYNSLVEKGVKVIVLKHKRIYDLRNVFGIVKIIKKNNYDIVHSHLFPTQYWVAFSSLFIKNAKIKYVTTEHSNNNRRRNNIWFKYLDTFIYSKYDSIISITPEVEENLTGWIDKERKYIGKYKVIENGIDIEHVKKAKPYRKDRIIDCPIDDVKIISMVGRFDKAKDQSTIIRAMKRLPDNTQLLLIGEGQLQNENKELSKKLSLENRVKFLGFRDDVYRILKTSDIIVLSSYWEGLSIAALEALASGKPFIASRVMGLEDLISGYGLMFEQGNDLELSILINQLLHNQDFYDETVRKCLMRAEDYSMEKMKVKLLREYKRLLSK